MQSNITVNTGGEQTELQNAKWLELSAHLFKMPVGELSDYADWLDEFSDVELIQYCQPDYHKWKEFRQILEFWFKPTYERLKPFFAVG